MQNRPRPTEQLKFKMRKFLGIDDHNSRDLEILGMYPFGFASVVSELHATSSLPEIASPATDSSHRCDSPDAKQPRRCSSVVGAIARILCHAAAELTECDQHHSVEVPLGFQIVAECQKRIAEFPHEPVVGLKLIRVRVVSPLAHVVNAGRQTACNHARHQAEAVSDGCLRVLNRAFVLF